MCTLLIARNRFRFYPLVVATNRDERLLRPSSPPVIWDGQPTMLAPIDDVFGGTWLGVNDCGVLVAVTNRVSVPHVKGRLLSRGALVPSALEGRTATEALKRVLDFDGAFFNGFHLAIVDANEGYIALGDGKTIVARPMEDGLSVITEQGWERAHSARALRLESVFRKETVRGPPTRANLSNLLNLHDDPFSEPGEMGCCLHGSPDNEWVTKSSAFARITRREGYSLWEYHHRERQNDRPNCESNWVRYDMRIR